MANLTAIVMSESEVWTPVNASVVPTDLKYTGFRKLPSSLGYRQKACRNQRFGSGKLTIFIVPVDVQTPKEDPEVDTGIDPVIV